MKKREKKKGVSRWKILLLGVLVIALIILSERGTLRAFLAKTSVALKTFWSITEPVATIPWPSLNRSGNIPSNWTSMVFSLSVNVKKTSKSFESEWAWH